MSNVITPNTTDETNALVLNLMLELVNIKSAIMMEPEVFATTKAQDGLLMPEIEPILAHAIEHVDNALAFVKLIGCRL